MAISPGGRPMDTSPFSASRTSNWVARAGGLPDYIRGVAHALLRKGRARDESGAIEMAVGIIRNFAGGHDGHGNRVHPAVQAAAVKALAQWEAMRAKSHAHAGGAAARVIDLGRTDAEGRPAPTAPNTPAGKGGGRGWDPAKHPRVPAGSAGGGRFGTAAASTAAKAAKPRATPQQKARKKAAALKSRAARDRVRAARLARTIAAYDTRIKAGAALVAAGKATAAKKTALANLRTRRAAAQARMRKYLATAKTLDRQAAAVKLAGEGETMNFLDLAFAEALVDRQAAGKPEGGQFRTPIRLTRHDTPEQAARAVNAMDERQRAQVRATTLPPPGFEWARGDRLAAAT